MNEFNISNIKTLKEKCKDENEFKEILFLKEIFNSFILKECELNIYNLDSRGNKINGWSIGEKRGGFNYLPPMDWTGFGLKVLDRYDNNDWLGNNGNENEWAVVYHGFSDDKILKYFFRTGFAMSVRQIYWNDEDSNHLGNKVGKGIYFSPDPNIMEQYSGNIKNKNGLILIVGLMVRVDPKKIRIPKSRNDFWILDQNYVRPYRILVKHITK